MAKQAQSSATTARRRELRRNVPRPAPRWWLWVRRRAVGWAALWALTLTVFISLIAIVARQRPPYYVGQQLDRTVVARVDFQAIDQEQTKRNRERAEAFEPPIYRPNPNYFRAVRERLDELIRYAQDPLYANVENMPQDAVDNYGLTNATMESLRRYIVDGQPNADWTAQLERFLDDLSMIPALDHDDYTREHQAGTSAIVLARPAQGATRWEVFYRNMLIEMPAQREAFLQKVTAAADSIRQSKVRPAVIAAATLDQLPTYLFDKEATAARREQAYHNPANIAVRTYARDDVLARAGDVLAPADVELLSREQRVYRGEMGFLQPDPEQREAYEAQSATVVLRTWARRVGFIGAVFALSVGLWVYLLTYNTRIAENPMRGLALSSLLILCLGLAVGLYGMGPQYAHFSATLPTLIAAMILAIAYDQRLALAVGAVHIVLVTLALNLSVGFGVSVLAGVGVAACQLDEVRTRSKLLLVGLWTALGLGFVTVVVGLMEEPLHLGLMSGVTHVLFNGAMAAVSGVGAGLLVQGVLPVIEKTFRVTTSMTLKELNDASHPLLRRLAEEAGGTYQHSLRIADMAEAAADSIGAHGLICRVGAMYHDIGKVNKPLYFIENQGGGPNRHNKLSPAMSLLIIVGHVKDGIELAREYGLPQPIKHLIESHHGTTLVEYFYHAARKQKEAEDAPAPTEFEFRYPGPKPQTKEAAIVLLSDSVEAAVRALPDPTPVRIEQRVREIANKRLMDGQFDESNITLQELYKIEQAIVKTLNAIYHGRIKYPGADSGTPRPEPARPDAETPAPTSPVAAAEAAAS